MYIFFMSEWVSVCAAVVSCWQFTLILICRPSDERQSQRKRLTKFLSHFFIYLFYVYDVTLWNTNHPSLAYKNYLQFQFHCVSVCSCQRVPVYFINFSFIVKFVYNFFCVCLLFIYVLMLLSRESRVYYYLCAVRTGNWISFP